MSALTTPTRVTSGMSRPLVTRLVPTRTSRRPSVNASITRSAAPLRSTTSRSRRPTRRPRKALADLALDPFGTAAEVADPGRGAGRAAGRQRRGRAAVMAAQGHAGLVEDERPLALRAGLDGAAVAAHHDRGAAAPVDHQDRPLARRRVEACQLIGQTAGDQAPVAGRQLGPQVHDLDDRRRAARPAGQDHPAPGTGSHPAHRLDRRRGAAQDDRGTGQLGQPDRAVAGLQARRPVALVGRPRAPRRRSPGRGRRTGRGPPGGSRPRHRPCPPGPGATRRPARLRPGPSGAARSGHRDRPAGGPPAAAPGRSRARAGGPAGRVRGSPRSPRRRPRSCRRRSRRRAGAASGRAPRAQCG